MGKGPGLHKKMFDERKSGFQKYKEFCVGNQGFFKFVKYEVFTSLLGPLPGALGFFLRKIFYKKLFKKIGHNVYFGRNVIIRHPHKIEIADNVIIDDNCLLDAKGENNNGIIIGNNVTIGRYSALNCKDGDINIGSNVNITTHVNIVVAKGGCIRIGNNIDIGSFTHFSGGTYDMACSDRLPSAQGQISRGIILQDLVWVGAGVIILDGVQIGEGAVIGAGAVVNQDIPPKSVAVGIPAKVIRQRE